jgi:hypothetical protein
MKSKKIVDYQFDKRKISSTLSKKLKNANYKAYGLRIRDTN